MAPLRHSPLTDPTVQISRSGFVERTHHRAQGTQPCDTADSRASDGDIKTELGVSEMVPSPEASARAPPSLQWVSWPLPAGALRFPTFIGTMRLYDCSPIRPRLPPVSLGSRYLPDGRRWGALLGSWEIPMEACPELGTPADPDRPRNTGRPSAAFRQANGVGIRDETKISELNLHGLLPCCVRFAPTSRPVNGNTRYRPACSL